MENNQGFVSSYLAYVGDTECPTFYHRWCCLSMLGAYLGRQYTFSQGHFEFCPNIYCMLIGVPGARKSTAIKIAKKIIKLAGYEFISADKTSKEKFMLDLAGENQDELSADDILDRNIFGTSSTDAAEMYIACDEFNDFIGNGNLEFISLLGNLWDYSGEFKNRIKNGKSVCIKDPTISILGGNTPTNFAKAFPADILGQGFFSRLLLIYGESNGKQITFPQSPSAEETESIVQYLQFIKQTVIGHATLNTTSKKLLDKIYKTWKPIDDVRFESYSARRFTHLLKLTLIVSASYGSVEINESHIIEANTILTHTEFLMPKALGEFGKSKNSDIAHKVMKVLENATHAMTLIDIWKAIPNDLEKSADLSDILRNLKIADKIFVVDGGFLAKKKAVEETQTDVLDYSFLTSEEREMKA